MAVVEDSGYQVKISNSLQKKMLVFLLRNVAKTLGDFCKTPLHTDTAFTHSCIMAALMWCQVCTREWSLQVGS